MAGLNALGHARALVVGEVEEAVAEEFAAEGAAELVAVVGGALLREVVGGVEVGVAEELEGAAVKIVVAGLGGDQHLAATEVAVLGVEVAGKNAELGDGVEVGNDGGDVAEVFFHRAAVDGEAIGGFALAADGDIAGIEVAGGRRGGAAGHDHGIGLLGALRDDSGLQTEQVGKAAAVDRHGDELGLADATAKLRGREIHLAGGSGDFDGFLILLHLEDDVEMSRRVGAELDGVALEEAEADGRNLNAVGAGGNQQLKGAVGVGFRGAGVHGGRIGGRDLRIGDDGATRIGDGAGEAESVAGVEAWSYKCKQAKD